MSENNSNPPEGDAGTQGGAQSTPPTTQAPKKDPPATPPAKKSASQVYCYGSPGVYASSDPDHKAPGKGLKFGDQVEFTPEAFAELPLTLRAVLVPEKDWQKHVDRLRHEGKLRKSAVVPGAK